MKRSKQKSDRQPIQRPVAVVIALILLLAIVVGVVYITRPDSPSNGGSNEPEASGTSQNIEDLEYEELSFSTGGVGKRYAVYVNTADKKQIAELNNKLYTEYKNKQKGSFFIDYFDDKKVAEDFFVKLQSIDTSVTQKQRLVSHYVGVFTYAPDKQQLYHPADQSLETNEKKD